MNFRKFATLILFAILVIGVSKTSVSVAAESTANASVASTRGAVVTASSKNTSVRKKDKKKYTESELRLMSAIINCEAGGESYQGQLAVGIVIMNRIRSRQFPNTLRGVIYQKHQFSPVRNGALKKKLAQYDAGRIKSAQWRSCIRAAEKVLNGQTYITYHGRKKSMKGYHFFSVSLAGARFRLGGHRFK